MGAGGRAELWGQWPRGLQDALPGAVWSRVGKQWALLAGHMVTLRHCWCVWAARNVVNKTEPHCHVWGQPLVGRWDGARALSPDLLSLPTPGRCSVLSTRTTRASTTALHPMTRARPAARSRTWKCVSVCCASTWGLAGWSCLLVPSAQRPLCWPLSVGRMGSPESAGSGGRTL